jgi:ankyrin repeat protein
MSLKTKQLQLLLNHLADISLDDFKKEALALVQSGADLNVYSSSPPYRTVLHHLVLNNKKGVHDKAIIELLKLKPGHVDVKDAYGNSALRALLNQATINQCSAEDFKRTAMLLASNGADLRVYGSSAPYRTVLHHLVLTNKDEAHDQAIIELLKLKPGLIDVKDAYGNSALRSLLNQATINRCSAEDFKRTAMLLASNGADLSVCGNSAPYRTLVHHLVLTNKDGVHDEAIAELLQLKPDLFSTPDGYGNLPLDALIYAEPNISVNAFKRAITLAGEKALHYTNAYKATLLHSACSIGNFAVAQYLVSKGLDVAAKTEHGDTLLHVSARSHTNQAIWQWLYENKININAQNRAKQTALHLALHSDNQEMVQWLYEHNANRYVRDIEGNTAAALAKSLKMVPTSSLLKSETPQDKLFASIDEIKEYGYYLSCQGAPKGQVAIDLADALYQKASSYFAQDAATANFPKFKEEFSALLKSKNHEMSEYRTSWSTIIANVLIAMTGVGLLLMAGKLVHSGITKGRPLFFFQKPRTTSEEKLAEVGAVLEEVDAAFDEVDLPSEKLLISC